MIALVAVLHFGAVWTGFYDWQFGTGVIWFDNVLHALVGVGFAMAALMLAARRALSGMATVFFVIAAVLILAALWELVEYVFYTRFTEYAYWSKIYSPSIAEALSDIASDLIGGAALLAIVRTKRRIP
jgi:hypothetical protein